MEELSHKILIVDDELNMQSLLSEGLATAKRTILTAGTLAEACEVVDKHKIDVVVLDRMLPDGDGLEFCAKLRPETNFPSLEALTVAIQKDIRDTRDYFGI